MERHSGIRRHPKHETRIDLFGEEAKSLGKARVAAKLPAEDLARAERFYAECLGLTPIERRSDGLLYRCAGAEFSVVRISVPRTAEAPPRTSPQMVWEVDDIESAVARLVGRGVVFDEESSSDGGTGIVEVGRGFPGAGAHGARLACFRDSEGNVLALHSPVL
ncbi:VOC family protein [Streptomyces sp. NPDC016845]|uniref:VOC family protein n=1 Tax=Streptomyces sp. NPDC016845 TaxID=3364972 RepID=UPI0037A49341